ncbi:hypothetical protein VTL71DRAFT_14680 [Oculimacula yallundae]|uniref:Uncharacterized protein n=1 Tax=Oculimacula yallundae TaxID=86028 RepID=A0ABR4CJR7_9HELO
MANDFHLLCNRPPWYYTNTIDDLEARWVDRLHPRREEYPSEEEMEPFRSEYHFLIEDAQRRYPNEPYVVQWEAESQLYQWITRCIGLGPYMYTKPVPLASCQIKNGVDTIDPADEVGPSPEGFGKPSKEASGDESIDKNGSLWGSFTSTKVTKATTRTMMARPTSKISLRLCRCLVTEPASPARIRSPAIPLLMLTQL